jgi:hypothetical protein
MRTSRAVKNPVITMALTVATMVTTFAGANANMRLSTGLDARCDSVEGV